MNKNNIRLRIGNNDNAEQVFKAIISHPMETGYRREIQSGRFIPADYIENVQISVDGKKYFEMTLGEFVSTNPYIAFTFTRPLIDKQIMRISWIENNKNETFYDCVIKFKQNGVYSFKGNEYSSANYETTHAAKPVCNITTLKVSP